jgi:uncharacterized membrane protein YjgN (DUF898 family)
VASEVPRWQLDLEDGPLRRELGLPPKQAQDQAPSRPMVYEEALRFDGAGSAYFRIWIVNVFLTLCTLGIYSAWAKVRKARWFAQQTSLAGDRFDYHGDPKRILLGRVVAVALLVAWSLAFEVSAWAGLVVVAVFCVLGPLLFASAQRFRLANTSWRGLRFGFDAPRFKVYAVCVPLLVLWTLSSVLEALDVSEGWLGAASLTTIAVFPWAHSRLKHMQHHHASFGQQGFSFKAAGPEFYGLYAKAIFVSLVGVLIALPIFFVLGLPALDDAGLAMSQKTLYTGLFLAAMGWLAAWPYFAARMQQIVWTHTHLGEVQFEGRMRFLPLFRLVLGQTVLTLLTAGLYWPFAAVAIARYRVESVVVASPRPLGIQAASMQGASAQRAAGDAAADFFGLDLGW